MEELNSAQVDLGNEGLGLYRRYLKLNIVLCIYEYL